MNIHYTNKSFNSSVVVRMVRPCTPLFSEYELGPTVFTALYACDKWAVPHVINPFVFGIFAQSWASAFFLGGIGELAEYTIATVFGSFVIFAGAHMANMDIENLTASYVLDWLLQAGVGSLLAWLHYNTLSYPKLMRLKDPAIAHFVYYLVLVVAFFIALPSALFLVPIGSHLYYIIQLGGILLMLVSQPRVKWTGYSVGQQAVFWLSWWLFNVILLIQNEWDWFFSRAVQSWVISAIYAAGLAVYGTVRWKWHERVSVSPIMIW